MSLREIIANEIQARGPIPFSRYMELCLYHPELGFYTRNLEQFGKAGDFYTSSDVHAVFGRLLARQFEEIWKALGSPSQVEILELGPGRGLLARDVLTWSKKKAPDLYRAMCYSLAERSDVLRERLKVTLGIFFEEDHAYLVPEIGTKDDQTVAPVAPQALLERALPPDVAIIIFANEFFDALPFEILSARGTLRVSIEGQRFVESWVPPSAHELEFLERYSVDPEAGERLEAPLAAHLSMSRLSACVRQGVVIAIDYGYTRQEQLLGRYRGTLMTYRRHAASPNAYEAPGDQDITAHVNFSSLAAAALEGGMRVCPLLTQSQFLMGIGQQNQFADAFEDCRLPPERAKVALQLKHLVTPAGVGESFHVLVATKGVPAAQIAGLSGLSFSRSRVENA